MKPRSFHVLHLSSVHPASDVRLLGKECATLAAAGHRVELWGHHPRSEVIAGVVIHPLPPVASRLQRMVWLPCVLLVASLRRRADFHHLHDPELLPLGMLLALTGRRVIYDIHEDVPGAIMTKYWIPPVWRRLLAWSVDLIERAAMQMLTGFIPATPAIARRFPPARTQVVQNLPRLEEFSAPPGPRQPTQDEAVFAYVGVISEMRGVREMLDALALTPAHFRLVFMGEMSPATLLDEMRQHPAWSKVTYLGQRPREEAARLMMSAHAGLVLFHPAPNHTESQPNKLFEYMAAGLPIIASDFPFWRALIAGEGCGLLVDPLDPAAISRAMIAVTQDPTEAAAMSRRGRAAVFERLNWSTEGARLVDFYTRLAEKPRHPVI